MKRPAPLSGCEQKALDVLVERLYAEYPEQVQSVLLFGSKARGDAGPESDIDVVVTLTNDDPNLRSAVRRLAARVSLEHDLLLSVQAVSRSRWKELVRYRFPLYEAIISEGLDLTPEPA